MLNKLIHKIKYHYDPEYRKNYDSELKFMRIMSVNNSIISSLKEKRGENHNVKMLA